VSPRDPLRGVRRFLGRNAAALVSTVLPQVGRIVAISDCELADRKSEAKAREALGHVRGAVFKLLATPLLARSSPQFGYDQSIQTTLSELTSELRAEHDGKVWFSSGHAEWFRLLAVDLSQLSAALAAETAVDVPFLSDRDREAVRRLHGSLAEAATAARQCGELHAELAWHEARNTGTDPVASLRTGKAASDALPKHHSAYARGVLVAFDEARRLTERS
jgi:hypothetical protein